MRNLRRYFQVVLIVAVVAVPLGILLGSTNAKVLLAAIFAVSVLNDLARRIWIKRRPWYSASMILSLGLAAILKCYIGSWADGYLYALLVELVLRDPRNVSVPLVVIQFVALLSSELLIIAQRHNVQDEMHTIGNNAFYYFLAMCILFLIRSLTLQKERTRCWKITQSGSKSLFSVRRETGWHRSFTTHWGTHSWPSICI